MISSVVQLAPFQEFETSAAPTQATLGALAIATDGRAFKYGLAGASNLAAGKLCQSSAVVANHQNIAVNAAAAVGATTVTATLGATAATAGQYAGGYMIVNDVDGEGNTYQIATNAAADSGASISITLADGIRVALTTSSEVSLVAAPYNGVIVMPTTITGVAVGVPVCPITAAYYGWFCVNGVVSCLGDGTLTVGSAVSPSNAVAGAVENGVIAQGFVGNAYQTGVDTEYRGVFINLA